MGLHRVGETLVLDGNLGEVLAPTADATKASAPAPPPPSRGGVAPTANPGGGAATINMQGSAPPGRSSSMSSNTVVGGGEKEGRWVMVGRGGKPQRDEKGWEHEAEGARVADSGVAAAAFARDQEGTGKAGGGGAERSNGKGRGWEDTGGVGGREQQAQTNVGAGAGWSIQQGSWPTLGASASDMVGSAHPGGGILSIVPSRSRVDSFGVRPPEPAGFWRAVQWELGGMHLMLGSSLPVRTYPVACGDMFLCSSGMDLQCFRGLAACLCLRCLAPIPPQPSGHGPCIGGVGRRARCCLASIPPQPSGHGLCIGGVGRRARSFPRRFPPTVCTHKIASSPFPIGAVAGTPHNLYRSGMKNQGGHWLSGCR